MTLTVEDAIELIDCIILNSHNPTKDEYEAIAILAKKARLAAKYRTALEFYAAEENYDDAGTPFYYISPDQFNNPNGRKDDKGDKAREALGE